MISRFCGARSRRNSRYGRGLLACCSVNRVDGDPWWAAAHFHLSCADFSGRKKARSTSGDDFHRNVDSTISHLPWATLLSSNQDEWRIVVWSILSSQPEWQTTKELLSLLSVCVSLSVSVSFSLFFVCHQGQICKKANLCLNLYPCVIKYYLSLWNLTVSAVTIFTLTSAVYHQLCGVHFVVMTGGSFANEVDWQGGWEFEIRMYVRGCPRIYKLNKDLTHWNDSLVVQL